MATVPTTTETPPTPDAAEARTFPPHRLTVDRYERMVAAGIFSAKEPIFLWHGRLVEKIPSDLPPPWPSTYPEHRLTVDRYERMVAAGIFSEKEPIFLWHGRLVEKMTKGCPHAFAVLTLAKALDRLLPDGLHVRQEGPVVLGRGSEPEPDLSVVRGTLLDYRERHPTSRDVALIIEVAASSVAIDSGDVLETYAAEGIPIYWIVNIPGRRVEVYTDPDGPSYRVRRDHGPGEEVPVVLDGREVGRVAVDAILP